MVYFETFGPLKHITPCLGMEFLDKLIMNQPT